MLCVVCATVTCLASCLAVGTADWRPSSACKCNIHSWVMLRHRCQHAVKASAHSLTQVQTSSRYRACAFCLKSFHCSGRKQEFLFGLRVQEQSERGQQVGAQRIAHLEREASDSREVHLALAAQHQSKVSSFTLHPLTAAGKHDGPGGTKHKSGNRGGTAPTHFLVWSRWHRVA